MVHGQNIKDEVVLMDDETYDVDGTIAADELEADRCLKELHVGIEGACFASL